MESNKTITALKFLFKIRWNFHTIYGKLGKLWFDNYQKKIQNLTFDALKHALVILGIISFQVMYCQLHYELCKVIQTFFHNLLKQKKTTHCQVKSINSSIESTRRKPTHCQTELSSNCSLSHELQRFITIIKLIIIEWCFILINS